MADDNAFKKNDSKDENSSGGFLSKSPFNKLAMSVTNNLRKLYQNVTFSTPFNKESREDINRNIDKYLDQIISSNQDISGEGNISRLYKRVQQLSNDPGVVGKFKDLFSDKVFISNILSSYSQNRFLYDYDAEIDVVLRYMPKLREALSVLKDNVLSTDHFSKDFISVVNTSDISNEDMFVRRIEELKTTYNLLENIEKWYMETSKYGECFIYVVPYNKGIAQLIRDKQPSTITRGTINMEAMTVNTGDGNRPVPESWKTLKDTKNYGLLTIELCHSNCINSVYEEYERDQRQLKILSEQSMATYFTEHAILEVKDDTTSKQAKTDKGLVIDQDSVTKDDKGNRIKSIITRSRKKEDLIPDEKIGEYLKNIDKDVKSDDGLYDLNKLNNNDAKFNIPGAIVKKLDRHNIIPIIIEDEICMGYYYFEFQEKKEYMLQSGMRLSDPMMNATTGSIFGASGENPEHDKALRYISAHLSKYIDANFVNKNQDLKKEIYAILKYNQVYNTPTPNKMRVTFIPAEDIHHFYYKLDPYTKRGQSDLHNSMLPAKLYSAMYITASIMTMTRGYDKRFYYINPGLEANLTEVLMNTIAQIKQGNFGIRQIRNNLNQVLNIQGRFNDYFVLKSPSGDSPLNTEIMPGQNVELKSELMTLLEELSINPTDVPLELLQTRMNSMDYAIQLSMSSSKFLRVCFKRQSKTNKQYSRLLTKIYNYHYNNQDVLEFSLPSPTFLSITNSSQFFQNVADYAMKVCEILWDGDPQDENGKQLFIKEIQKNIAASYYNKETMHKLLNKAKQKARIVPLPAPQPGQQ